MTFNVVMNNQDEERSEKIARIVLQKLKNNEAAAKPLFDVPEEVKIIGKAYRKIYKAISDIFPEIRNEKLVLYLYSREEGKRTNSGGMCIGLKNGYYAIGINEKALLYDGYLTYILFHEIAHLKYYEHSKRFYALLDVLIDIYNSRTGEQIENKYEERVY